MGRKEISEKELMKLRRLQNKAWLIIGDIITLEKELSPWKRYVEKRPHVVSIHGLFFPVISWGKRVSKKKTV